MPAPRRGRTARPVEAFRLQPGKALTPPPLAPSFNNRVHICDNTNRVRGEVLYYYHGAYASQPSLSHGKTELWGAVYMANMQLFGQTYSLPSVANERFRLLRQEVNEQSRPIQAGVRLRPRW